LAFPSCAHSQVDEDEAREDTEEPAHGGEAGQEGEWFLILQFLGYVTVFIGLLNLLPLPPFDGGHLALIAIEKVRGRPVDFRRVVPISVAVLAFFAIFVGATMILDIAEPITRSP